MVLIFKKDVCDKCLLVDVTSISFKGMESIAKEEYCCGITNIRFIKFIKSCLIN